MQGRKVLHTIDIVNIGGDENVGEYLATSYYDEPKPGYWTVRLPGFQRETGALTLLYKVLQRYFGKGGKQCERPLQG